MKGGMWCQGGAAGARSGAASADDDGASVRCRAWTWDDAAGGAKASAVDVRWAAATRKETKRTIIVGVSVVVGCTPSSGKWGLKCCV
jgi:hypothetical protein